MDETKYGKYIRNAEGLSPVGTPMIKLVSDPDYGGPDFTLGLGVTTKSNMDGGQPHRHDFAQYLGFFGTDPDNLMDLGGSEIELTLGEEREVNVITKGSIVYIPKGLLHLPLVLKTIKKPLISLNMYFSHEYIRKP